MNNKSKYIHCYNKLIFFIGSGHVQINAMLVINQSIAKFVIKNTIKSWSN